MTAIPRVMISHKMFAHLIHTNIRNFRHCCGVFGVFFFCGGVGGRGNYMFSYGFFDIGYNWRQTVQNSIASC